MTNSRIPNIAFERPHGHGDLKRHLGTFIEPRILTIPNLYFALRILAEESQLATESEVRIKVIGEPFSAETVQRTSFVDFLLNRDLKKGRALVSSEARRLV